LYSELLLEGEVFGDSLALLGEYLDLEGEAVEGGRAAFVGGMLTETRFSRASICVHSSFFSSVISGSGLC
jgi:hypothetical protein